MQLFFNIIISTLLQFILFALLPFIWWFITARKKNTFFKWLGYKKIYIVNKKRFWLSIIGIGILFSILLLVIIPMILKNAELATSQFNGLGASAIVPALIYAFFQTAFNEEMFFRGFLGKRLANKYGFAVGNTVQGLLFGMMHGIMFFTAVGLFGTLIIIVFTGVIGGGMGYVNEKESEGSIIPSWLLHGCANAVSSVFALFIHF